MIGPEVDPLEGLRLQAIWFQQVFKNLFTE